MKQGEEQRLKQDERHQTPDHPSEDDTSHSLPADTNPVAGAFVHTIGMGGRPNRPPPTPPDMRVLF